ncbi:hypothetical protein PC9H_009071 [Pleurotus ostreatus]|uniref:F-box domain-containing protein n=2 Tax=Pleurotus ostreatus TaxID=5322 RepID=A0A067NX14_PLEO1|nr:uncharacterized protein PC9H_009071 [Pleurotus ostreatus]KAF7426702.1 hypothetical protein PC9H_009071 [Pleurotus ostreatus]KDQ32434.1 hypothetical protein PLEOSDRAFT_1081577 [Pleurotus ostreatus PC15]
MDGPSRVETSEERCRCARSVCSSPSWSYSISTGVDDLRQGAPRAKGCNPDVSQWWKGVDTDPAVETAMIKILHFAASTLESLAFLATTPWTSTCLISHASKSMPALQRLHLSGNRNPHGLFQLGGLEASCPSISRLRISGVERAVAFAHELDGLLQPSSSPSACIASGRQAFFAATLPKKMRILMVQPAPVSVKSVRSARLTKDMMHVLEALDRSAKGEDGGVAFHVLDEQDVDDGSETKRLKADWMDRLGGGEGCWALRS